MDKRIECMKWWNNLSSAYKTQLCDTHTELVGNARRWETLTGSEIESIYGDKCRTDSEIMDLVFGNMDKD